MTIIAEKPAGRRSALGERSPASLARSRPGATPEYVRRSAGEVARDLLGEIAGLHPAVRGKLARDAFREIIGLRPMVSRKCLSNTFGEIRQDQVRASALDREQRLAGYGLEVEPALLARGVEHRVLP